ncbi:MAG: tetraacyldisaccharide 4'-kinase, partial [Candidatus Zixiibacteriota bacterium]
MSDLRSYMATVHSGKRRSFAALLLVSLLWPLSLIFRLIVALRNYSFERRIFKSHSLGCKVLSVGNLTTGGTGKTPLTIMIAERLQISKRVAILSRGYRSGNEHNSITLRGSEITSSAAALVGDELALMAARLPNVWFAVGADRLAGGKKLVVDEKIEIAVLEDAFQRRQIARDCDIVLVDASNPLGNGLFLPAGPLRESLKSLKRSSIVLLTRTESVDPLVVDQWHDRIAQIVPHDRIFRLHTDMAVIHSLDPDSGFSLADCKVWLFSGIGNPESFEILS